MNTAGTLPIAGDKPDTSGELLRCLENINLTSQMNLNIQLVVAVCLSVSLSILYVFQLNFRFSNMLVLCANQYIYMYGTRLISVSF